MVLQREGDAGIAGELACFHQALTAPGPRLFLGEAGVLGLPDVPREVVAAAALGQQGDAGPGKEDAYDLRAEVRRHAEEIAQVNQLRFPVAAAHPAACQLSHPAAQPLPVRGAQRGPPCQGDHLDQCQR